MCKWKQNRKFGLHVYNKTRELLLKGKAQNNLPPN